MQQAEIDNHKRVLAANLRAARRLAGLTMSDASDLIYGKGKNNKNRLSEYENGEAVPNIMLLIRMSRAYAVSLDYLVGLSSEPERDLDSARAGQIMGMMHQTGQRMMTMLAAGLAKITRQAPKGAVCQLVEASKAVSRQMHNVATYTDFVKTTPGGALLVKQVEAMAKAARAVESDIERQMRVMERAVQDIALHDEGASGHLFAWDEIENEEQLELMLKGGG